MDVSRDSWGYKLWAFTFVFYGSTPPRNTNRLRYNLRKWLMPIPVSVGLVCFFVYWLMWTVLGNTVTTLSGTGIIITWTNCPHVSRFKNVHFGLHRVPPQLIALVIWLCIVAGLLAYYWPHEALMVTKWALYVAIVPATVWGIIKFADGVEVRDLPLYRGRATQPVTFYSPKEPRVNSKT